MAPKDDPIYTNFSQIASFTSARNNTYPYIDPTQFDLAGKAVFVTGASKGIGRATAISFARAGCSRIAIAARSKDLLEQVAVDAKNAAKAAGRPEPQVLVLQLDVTSAESVQAAAEATEDAFDGVLDVLVNNAGYLEPWVPFLESDPKEWWRSWEVNLLGPYLCARYLLPLVLRSTSTKLLVNVSSGGANLLNPGGSAYDTARFALCRLTEFIEAEFEVQGLITVAIHPGAVSSDLSRRLPERWHEALVDGAELPADTIVWLAGERRGWLNGRFVSVNWDMEELVGRRGEVEERDLLRFRMKV